METDNDAEASAGNLTRAVNPIQGLGKDCILSKYWYEI